MLAIFNQFDAVADMNLAALYQVAVQGQLAIEFPHYFFEYATVLQLRIWIEGSHHAAHAKILDADNDFSDFQALPLPRALVQTVHATDDNIRTEPSAIVAEGRDGAIGCYQQRQYVEALRRIIAYQASAGSSDVYDLEQHLRVGPEQTIDSGLARGIERSVMTQQPRMRSGGYDMSACIFDVDDTISGNAEGI
jgi:hypothetical protein